MTSSAQKRGTLIVLVGPSGVGKSTISRKLAEKMRLKSKLDQQKATLVPIEFAAASRSSAVREKDVARVISADKIIGFPDPPVIVDRACPDRPTYADREEVEAESRTIATICSYYSVVS